MDRTSEVHQDIELSSSSFLDKLNPQLWPQWAKLYFMSWGMFTSAYDLLVINLVLLILNQYDGISSWQNSYLANSCIFGTILGQLFGGFFADRFGRVILARVACILLIVGALGAAFLSWNVLFINMFIILALWRVVTGLGVGGEYPVGAIFAAEQADNKETRGTTTASVFSAQGIGNLFTSVIFFLLLISFGEVNIRWVWRLSLAFGAIPALLILLPRFLLKESIFSYQLEHKERQSLTASTTKVNEEHHYPDLPQKTIFKIILRYYWKRIIGTAGSWFLFDIVFYGNSLFTSQILHSLGSSITSNVAGNILIALIALPGYWFAVFTIDKFGRKPLQLFGFTGMMVMYIGVGVFYKEIVEFPLLFISLYGLSYFFGNAGPNTTTYVIPSEAYPRKIRSTCHGFSAACGKFGAFLGSTFMKPLLTFGTGYVLILCGVISILGLIVTYFFITETKKKDLNELEVEFNGYIKSLDTHDDLRAIYGLGASAEDV